MASNQGRTPPITENPPRIWFLLGTGTPIAGMLAVILYAPGWVVSLYSFAVPVLVVALLRSKICSSRRSYPILQVISWQMAVCGLLTIQRIWLLQDSWAILEWPCLLLTLVIVVFLGYGVTLTIRLIWGDQGVRCLFLFGRMALLFCILCILISLLIAVRLIGIQERPGDKVEEPVSKVSKAICAPAK